MVINLVGDVGARIDRGESRDKLLRFAVVVVVVGIDVRSAGCDAELSSRGTWWRRPRCPLKRDALLVVAIPRQPTPESLFIAPKRPER